MKLLRCLLVPGMVALTATAYAQPPRPTVAVRQPPEMERSVWPADFNRDGRTDLIAGAMAGVMFRESLAAASKHVMGAVYAAGGVVLQQRAATGGSSSEAARRAGTAPEWLRLTRSGNTFTVAASNDVVTWATVGSTTVAMNHTIYVGLPVTSRVAGTLATAVFDDVWIRP